MDHSSINCFGFNIFNQQMALNDQSLTKSASEVGHDSDAHDRVGSTSLWSARHVCCVHIRPSCQGGGAPMDVEYLLNDSDA